MINELNVANDELTKFPERELTTHIRDRLLKEHVADLKRREQLLTTTHALGHFGADQLFKQIWRQGYFWPTLRSDCQKTVLRCRPCHDWNSTSGAKAFIL